MSGILLAISIYVVISVIFGDKHSGLIWKRTETGFTIYYLNLLLIPSSIYLIYFILQSLKIIS
jgi:hypothetical protein